jgi:hypothetical protein
MVNADRSSEQQVDPSHIRRNLFPQFQPFAGPRLFGTDEPNDVEASADRIDHLHEERTNALAARSWAV